MEKYFNVLVNEIHSVVVATVDDYKRPVTRVIDMMLYDHTGIYFLTAKGKLFYDQLIINEYISITGMTSDTGTMKKKAISISGSVQNIEAVKLNEIFEKNQYMKEIYPSVVSRNALQVFKLYKGQGEYFDLSTQPITRESFSFGEEHIDKGGYNITKACEACGLCTTVCPQKTIQEGATYIIEQNHCLHCGNCYEICPHKAIAKK